MSKSSEYIRAKLCHYLYVGCSKLLYPQKDVICIILMHNYLDIIESRYCGSWKENWIVLISTLLFLNGKLTENIRTIRDSCSVVILLFNNDYDCGKINDDYIKIKKLVIEKENFILKVIGFVINIEIPIFDLERLCKDLSLGEDYMKIAVVVLNDCFLNRKSINTDYILLASSALFISIKLLSKHNNYNDINNKRWWLFYMKADGDPISDNDLNETVAWIVQTQKKQYISQLENDQSKYFELIIN